MNSKKVLWIALGVVAAGLLAIFALTNFGDEPGKEPTTIEAPADSGVKPEEESRPVAVADSVRSTVNNRNQVGSATTIANSGVEGMVTNPQGQPVAGARVELVKAPSVSPFAAALQNKGGARPGDAAKVYSTSSGADGRYRLAAPAAENWRLTASHPEYARVEYQNIATLPDSFLSFAVTLKPGIRLYGRVTEDQKNMPVVGAIVVMDDPGSAPSFPMALDDKREVTTDGSGQFKFENVKPGRHSLSVRAQTYGTRDFPIVNIPEAETTFRHDIRLTPGKNISGRVLDAAGHFVPSAKVSASTAGLGVSHGNAVTNELGEFVIVDLEDGRYFISADAGDAGQGRTDPQTPILAGSVDVEVKLTARAGAQGVVKDRLTGQPISKFSVEVRRAAPNARAFPRESGPFNFNDRKDGSFEVSGIDAQGEHVVYVSAEGYAPNYSERFAVQQGQVTRGVDIALSIGGTITGRIVDARNNQPVVGASVRTRDNEWNDISGVPIFSALLEGMPQKTVDITATTDGDGKFEFKHIGDGVVQLYITHPQFVSLQQKEVNVTDGVKTDVGSIKLSTGCMVKGTVYGADGAPAANAEVRIQMKAQIGGAGRGIMSKTIRTDATGKYMARSLSAGDYIFSANSGAGGNDNIFGKIIEGKNTRKEVTLVDGSEQEVDLFLTTK